MIMQNYIYNGTLINVVDGDTVDVQIDLGFYTHTFQRMRLSGIDTPELNSQDPEQRELAKKARDFVKQFLGQAITLKSYKKDKYGRFLAEIYLTDGSTINSRLLSEGLAKPYDGGAR
jgi:micrococcal nuclease